MANEEWKKWDVNSAIRQVRDESDDFFRLLQEIEHNPQLHHDCFVPLNIFEGNAGPFPFKGKAWERRRRPLLRMYGLKFADGKLLTTGAGIKLTRTIQEDQLLQDEMTRIKRVKHFLKKKTLIFWMIISYTAQDNHANRNEQAK